MNSKAQQLGREIYTLLEKISGTIFQTAVILEPFDLGP